MKSRSGSTSGGPIKTGRDRGDGGARWTGASVSESPGLARSIDELADAAQLTTFERAVVEVLLATNPGDVMSYGDVAAEAGHPGAARAVGGVLRRVDGLPWWRVVSAAGRLIPHDPARQAALLRAEGVTVAAGHVVTNRP
jgi:methylated-DNA-protein-cysteine methyltransferase-like protein